MKEAVQGEAWAWGLCLNTVGLKTQLLREGWSCPSTLSAPAPQWSECKGETASLALASLTRAWYRKRTWDKNTTVGITEQMVFLSSWLSQKWNGYFQKPKQSWLDWQYRTFMSLARKILFFCWTIFTCKCFPKPQRHHMLIFLAEIKALLFFFSCTLDVIMICVFSVAILILLPIQRFLSSTFIT